MLAERTELPEWSGVEDLSAWLGVPPRTFHKWHSQHTGPRAHKIGRHLRYRRADVEAWLAEQADQPGVAS